MMCDSALALVRSDESSNRRSNASFAGPRCSAAPAHLNGRVLTQGYAPRIVPVQPPRVALALLQPRVRAGNRLYPRGARLAVRFVTPERALDPVAVRRI